MQISDFFTLLNCFIWGIFENLDVWIQIILFFWKMLTTWDGGRVDPNRDPGEILAKSSFPTIIRLTQLAIIHLEIQAHIFLIEKAFDEIRAFNDL